jgi:hypothetical protein
MPDWFWQHYKNAQKNLTACAKEVIHKIVGVSSFGLYMQRSTFEARMEVQALYFHPHFIHTTHF